VPGVASVDDEVEIVPPGPSARDVQDSIKKAMERNAKLDGAVRVPCIDDFLILWLAEEQQAGQGSAWSQWLRTV
jgi:hypothetical protein